MVNNNPIKKNNSSPLSCNFSAFDLAKVWLGMSSPGNDGKLGKDGIDEGILVARLGVLGAVVGVPAPPLSEALCFLFL